MSTDSLWAVDTSTAVAYLDASHSAHRQCVNALKGRSASLAGHAAFETFAVLTRLPGQLQVTAGDALDALQGAFPDTCWLNARQQSALLARLGQTGITGGMTYDALVGEAARVNSRVLLTRDRRALGTYEFLGVRYELVG